MRISKPLRSGFTLVELLVVIGVSILLAALTVGIANSSAADSYKIVNGADRVSGWLLQAKSKAQREGAPRGVRFITNGNQITEAQFIEVPDAFNPVGTPTNPARVRLSQPNPTTLNITFLGAGVLAAIQNNVSPGDTLSLPEFGLFVPITAPIPNTGTISTTSSVLPVNASLDTTAFGFHRAARPMLGEPNLQVPTDMIIDIQLANTTNDSSTVPALSTSLIQQVNGEFDVIFAPNGEVLSATLPRIILWIRNIRILPVGQVPRTAAGARNDAGEMALVVVYTKTGAISTQPVMLAPNYADPYTAAKDGVNSGL